jgi:hypothetical protein
MRLLQVQGVRRLDQAVPLDVLSVPDRVGILVGSLFSSRLLSLNLSRYLRAPSTAKKEKKGHRSWNSIAIGEEGPG